MKERVRSLALILRKHPLHSPPSLFLVEKIALSIVSAAFLLVLGLSIFGSNARASSISTTLTMPQNSLGMVGHWTFDGPDMMHNVADSSGTGNTGYLINAATSSQATPGKLGQALLFNGTNQYIQTVAGSTLNTRVVTVSMWIRPTNSEGLFYHGTSSGSQNIQYAMDINGTSGFEVYIGGEGSGPTARPSYPFKFNRWYLVTLTGDGTNYALYVNGTLVSSGAEGTLATDISTQLYIGSSWNGANPFGGTMDDVRVYNRALSAAEVEELYQRGGTHILENTIGTTVAAPTSGLVGHWALDNNTDDSSGNGNDGTAVGSPSYVTGPIGQALSFNGSTQYVSFRLSASTPTPQRCRAGFIRSKLKMGSQEFYIPALQLWRPESDYPMVALKQPATSLGITGQIRAANISGIAD